MSFSSLLEKVCYINFVSVYLTYNRRKASTSKKLIELPPTHYLIPLNLPWHTNLRLLQI